MNNPIEGVSAISRSQKELLFIGAIPSKKNSKEIVRGRLIPSKRYRERHKIVVDNLRGIAPLDYDGPLHMTIDFIVGDKRRRDLDNAVSSIQDTLVDVGYLTDDNCSILKKLTITNLGYVKNCWLTRVKFSPHDEEQVDVSEDYKDKSREELIKLAEFYFH